MRGKPKRLMVDSFGDRITPADAGKTIKIIHFTFRTWDHPRGCGENSINLASISGGKGSPPRMRGKRLAANLEYVGNGITPADAGKTIINFIKVRHLRDHPRGCGENEIWNRL